MPKCNHHHNHQNADILTNTAAVIEAATSFISDLYWLATFFDTASGFEINMFGLSFYGLGFGTIIALLSASGAAYSHRTLNTHHQQSHVDKKNTVQKDIEATPCRQDIELETCNKLSPLIVEHEHLHLTKLQKLSLVGDFISHTGDVAGPIMFVVNLATYNQLPQWGKLVAQCSASLFGGIASVANVRTCKNAMEIMNNAHH